MAPRAGGWLFVALMASAWGLASPSLRAEPRPAVPLAERVAASRVIAVGTVVRVEGRGPFTVARPHTVVLLVDEQGAIRGCRAGTELAVPGFGLLRAPGSEVVGPAPPPDREVRPPETGSTWMVMLPEPPLDEERPRRPPRIEPAPMWFGTPPDPRTVELARGLAHFSVEKADAAPRIEAPVGAPVPLRFTLRNDTARPQTFALSSVRARAQGPEPDATEVEGVLLTRDFALGPHEARAMNFDLAAFFPTGTLDAPGDHWIRLEVPASPEPSWQVHLVRRAASPAPR